MPVPSRVHDVFRAPSDAAAELKHVLEDTAAFASEIFGLFDEGPLAEPDLGEERADLTATQMRGFLRSPLGDELATRIQLQPPYHGLVESDVVVMNRVAGRDGAAAEECIGRIERLLERIGRSTEHQAALFHCDPRDLDDHTTQSLYRALEPFCAGGR